MNRHSDAIIFAAWTILFAPALYCQQPAAVIRQTAPVTDPSKLEATDPVLDLSSGQIIYKKNGAEKRYAAPLPTGSQVRSSVSFDAASRKFHYTYSILDTGSESNLLAYLVMYLPASDTSREVKPKEWMPETERSEIGDPFSKVHLGRLDRVCFSRPETGGRTSFTIVSERRPGFIDIAVSGGIDPKARQDMKTDPVLRNFLQEKGLARYVSVAAPLLTSAAGDQEVAANLYQGIQSALFRGEIKREGAFAQGLLAALQPAVVGSGVAGRTQLAAVRAETDAERNILSIVNAALGDVK